MRIAHEIKNDDGTTTLVFTFDKGEILSLLFIAQSYDLEPGPGQMLVGYEQDCFSTTQEEEDFHNACLLHEVDLDRGFELLQLAVQYAMDNSFEDTAAMIEYDADCLCGEPKDG